MSDKYNPQKIEQKWQQRWEKDHIYRSKVDWDRPKHYALTMLPYPSGDLHIGHWYAMTPSDARARYMRMKGFNVLFPMGFDAFGLPAENAAIQRGIDPRVWTYDNIARMRKQLRSMGAMFDWEREAVSCDPEYYRWTEWFFKILFEHDLAYRGEALVNWSDALQTVLANEQVIDGKDERLGQPVVQKMMTQWFFRYTHYADELLHYDFKDMDWPEHIRTMQTNWIGRSEGATVIFRTEGGDPIEIYTTRPDTLWGATFMVLSPEHPLVDKVTVKKQHKAVEEYKAMAARQTEIERTAENKEKTGVFTGGYAINPVTKTRIPIWIADYVLITYGSGAIMAVPYGDQRDFEFARKFDLEIIAVVKPDGSDTVPDPATMEEAYDGPGTMVNSGPIDGAYHNGEKGRKSPAIAAAIDHLEKAGIGKEAVNYRLRDWLISRQRYWGAPIPIIYRQDGTMYAVKDEDLPVLLPDKDVKFMGPSPLKVHEEFRYIKDEDGNPAERETDTMDTFMCSSWYHLRYLSPHYDKAPFDPEEAAYWLPVDTYTGGTEHGTMHLLYTRWFNKALRDLDVFEDASRIAAEHGRRDVETMFDEPMLQLRNQGQILGEERRGNVIIATGKADGKRLVADHVAVIEPGRREEMAANARSGAVVGEIMRRTERTLQIDVGEEEWRIVEVAEDAAIEIPNIPGDNTVNQLKQHLEIQRMSKSKGNVVNPDELVQEYGADTVRAYLMFAFDWAKGGPWDSQQIIGVVRWLNDIWDIALAGAPGGDGSADRDVERKLHQTIAKVGGEVERFSFNTAISALMEFRNTLRAAIRDGAVSAGLWQDVMNVYLRLMAPFTPHIAEELWGRLGFDYSVHLQSWPDFDADKAKEDTVTLVVMVNGKPREGIQVSIGIEKAEAERLALASDSVKRALNGGQPKKVIFIPGRSTQEPKVNVVV